MIRRYVSPRRRPSRFRLPSWLWLLLAFGVMESVLHCRTFNAPRPTIEQDQPFYTSCREPDVTGKRENGVLVMLAKNSELKEANHTVASLEKHFNRWFHYPIVFLNNEPFDDRFIEVLNSTASGGATFEVIPQEDWTYPAWVNQTAAKSSIVEQGARGTMHAGQEGYHHMCRFYSGSFYQLEALRKYKWYWRLEPDVDFLCSITYDPFVEMARRKKVYGFTISLWEEWDTVPSLFRHTAEFKEAFDLASSALWKAMMEPSWLPYPLRPLMSLLPHRDQSGDAWSGCHYWSNFEIADLDFFRGKQYQAFFKALDDTGGFYFERWGDAAVHSLAVGMLLDADKVHHFEDFGYRHDELFQCPANAPDGQLPGSQTLGNASSYSTPIDGGIGCRCECDGKVRRNHNGYCLNKLKEPNTAQRPWFSWTL
ncbi:glycolipid 2-alpha-mannosyltransferase [Colletotrichum melonis]|uniref:Glycolipid 2-alpha-mannosyltransferase n=3 Tax=Colletotrichum acutatum species complex TaxID=2707335 RepID=A0AAJ0DUX5_9PEZI|nr:glycolipid 2-alpha-mannosyltransferase [Colletotrichum costaricense]XP_060389027.1 glycolipid 2-alpha-mannosyltransferase [Colletotrichum tamarilloi]KAK1452033.1 glycolipid 2-alpha-mannosyltransferase [Colletotrichum melonis]KAK1512953.1 glycolipid 2-alpha-mannosyltransferase [Colletotrichum tamarilloi]KAK1514426.1 glycolipid 2-alpha-mannosyltransferase [Colletotrichum costaricense]